MTFACINHLVISVLMTEKNLTLIIKDVTYLKKISMNSYLFFGFHIFKYFTVTFMYQCYPKTSLN